MEAVGVVSLVVAVVLPFAFAQGTNEVVLFIETVGITEGLVSRSKFSCSSSFSKKSPAVHLLRNGKPCKAKYGGTEVDEADETVRPRSSLVVREMLKVLGNTDHERNMQSTFVCVTFAAWKDSAMVAKVKDKGILKKTVCLELLDNCSDLSVR